MWYFGPSRGGTSLQVLQSRCALTGELWDVMAQLDAKLDIQHCPAGVGHLAYRPTSLHHTGLRNQHDRPNHEACKVATFGAGSICLTPVVLVLYDGPSSTISTMRSRCLLHSQGRVTTYKQCSKQFLLSSTCQAISVLTAHVFR